ncbi:hypothetical protein HYS47_05565 [Candidatus Woesearchaeota archaeon]|nr:hypothetical protein [Candidatus Woesearchaeota archaeon]
MQAVHGTRLKALHHLRLADHMVTQTYPLVQDPKILLVVLENLFLSLTYGMAALLEHERYHKQIPPFQETFDSKFNMIKLRLAEKYRITPSILQFILDVKAKVQAHRKSPVEFSRQGSLVICSEKYEVETITQDILKGYLGKSKIFLQHIEAIVGKHHE